jgi:hypothetical protein
VVGVRGSRLCLMEAGSICAACNKSGASIHFTARSEASLRRLLSATEGQIALIAWHVRVAPTPLLVLKSVER